MSYLPRTILNEYQLLCVTPNLKPQLDLNVQGTENCKEDIIQGL